MAEGDIEMDREVIEMAKEGEKIELLQQIYKRPSWQMDGVLETRQSVISRLETEKQTAQSTLANAAAASTKASKVAEEAESTVERLEKEFGLIKDELNELTQRSKQLCEQVR